MLKNKFITLLILFVTLLSVLSCNVFAADEADQNSTALISTTPTAEETTDTNVTDTNASDTSTDNTTNVDSSAQSAENYKTSDVFLTGSDVTVDYIVDGNLVVIANNVTISSAIGGDVLVIANTLTVSDTSYIYSNLFTTANNLTINGVVYDLYALSDTITVNGYIYRDIKAMCNTLNLYGYIGRNAFVSIDKLSYTNSSNITGKIFGNMNYTSNTEFSLPEGFVEGDVNYSKATSISPTVEDYIFSAGAVLVLVLILWCIIKYFAPKFTKTNHELIKQNILPVIGYGILGIILMPIIVVILLLLRISASVGLLLLSIYFILLAISSSIFTISIANIIAEKLKVSKTLPYIGVLIITAIILWALQFIPYAGSIIVIITMILGLGTIIKYVINSKKSNKAEKVEKKTDSKQKEEK